MDTKPTNPDPNPEDEPVFLGGKICAKVARAVKNSAVKDDRNVRQQIQVLLGEALKSRGYL